jgi:hypothetical protein
MNAPPPSHEPSPAKPGFRVQLLLAVVFALLALMIWWTSRSAPAAAAPELLAGDVQRGLLVPFVLGALCAAINAWAIHRGRVLAPALRASPVLVFVAALLVLRLGG